MNFTQTAQWDKTGLKLDIEYKFKFAIINFNIKAHILGGIFGG